MVVAKWYGIDPSAVKRWPVSDFMDRQEFMDIQIEIADYDEEDENSVEPGRVPWSGPKQ